MNGQRVARRDASGTVYYFFRDHLGSLRKITNASGGVVRDIDYNPWGAETCNSGTVDDPYKFTDHELDSESALYHTLYRKYSRAMGRWMSADPEMVLTDNPQNFNRYVYVLDNPTNLTDPFGLQPFAPAPAAQDPQSRNHGVCAQHAGGITGGTQRGPCRGTKSCEYYDRQCANPKVPNKTYYCRTAPGVCKRAGDNFMSNCIRLCLQERDNCWTIAEGRKFISCQAQLHAVCGGICTLECSIAIPVP
jgi:RHS repeat-associated protein